MEEKKEDTKEENHKHSHKKNLTNKIRENPWMLATILLAILCLILLIFAFTGNFTGNSVSAESAGQKLLAFYTAMGVEGLTLDSVEEVSGLYKINFEYEDAIIPFYVTKDGKSFIPGDYVSSFGTEETEETETSTEVVKSDKPVVELYIWSYCPYGVTALSPFADVAKLLGSFADFKVYLYYAGHGDHEEQQNKIQACIQELEPEKYWDYAKAFTEDIYTKCSGNITCDLEESTTLMKTLGIDSAKVLSCVSSQGEKLLEEDSQAAQDAGVQGSPTLIINGIQTSVSRTAEAYKGAVCSAFNEVPSACSQTLDSSAATTSGNC
ncbi:thioredoxin domain-containing protein [Candidatus Pacearchaeota archaeon]|jgi:protein-disulfide isomerase|nr:thioredoxin domain-containing protein [Candidatus Pacearchaeota archaeon]